MKSNLLTSLLILAITACTPTNSGDSIETWKAEIVEVERQFAEMAEKEGIPKAFLAFADENGVVQRSNKVVTVKDFYGEAERNENVSLTWKPDFVDVSASGDLAYTYGGYTFTSTDSLGNKSENTGTFHTVWKRQEDGSWKFVWD